MSAYIIFWKQFYDCKLRLQSVIDLDENLEIFVNDSGDLVAYRYDPPDILKGFEEDEGKWRVFKPQQRQSLPQKDICLN